MKSLLCCFSSCVMPQRIIGTTVVLFVVTVSGGRGFSPAVDGRQRTSAAVDSLALAQGTPAQTAANDLDRGFTDHVRPLLDAYCVACHGGAAPAAQFDLRTYTSLADVVQDHARWALVAEKLEAEQMPPAQAKQ